MLRAAVGPEHEVEGRIRHVVERHRPSASMNVTPSAEKSLCGAAVTRHVAGTSVVVSSSIVISTSPSRMDITCSV